jgi:hypothetical protein
MGQPAKEKRAALRFHRLEKLHFIPFSLRRRVRDEVIS